MTTDKSLSRALLAITALLAVVWSNGVSAQQKDDSTSGVELLSSGEKAVIRFPVRHLNNGWPDFGYLFFSASDISYEVAHPASDKDHSFRYARTDLTLAKEYYGGARLEFKNGRVYTFNYLARLLLPPDGVVQAAVQFDSASTAARAKALQRTSGVTTSLSPPDPLLSSSGDIVAGDSVTVLRFTVAQQDAVSCGYLYFTQQSIRYEVTAGAMAEAFSVDRSTLLKAKTYERIWAELQFSQKKRRFLVELGDAESPCRVTEPYTDLLEAVDSFSAAVAKAEFVNRGVISWSTAVAMASFNQRLAAWRDAGGGVDLPEEAVHHRVLAEAAFQERDFNKAASEYEKALQVYPTWPAGQFNSAQILGELHRYADAVAHMKAYLELTPTASDAQEAKQKIWIWEDRMK